MSPERWRDLREIFDQALSRPPSDVEDFLRQACGEDSSLYEEVRRMLAEHERSSPLDRAVWDNSSLGVFSAGQLVAGRYRIVRYLSRGGMGEVYEAEDLELGGRVALKTLLPEIAGDARMITRFKQEIQLSRKIGHANVCRVFDLSRHPADGSSPDTVFFLTMEFLAGETLAARLEREGRMTPAEALPLLEQMAQALDAAHRAGVIHRDLKPSNVMLTGGHGSAEPRAVVTDFGLARSYTPETESTASMSGRVMGTVDYMAPELLTGAQATFASDIYALGMVAYKMVTGALPFASDTPLAAAILRSKEPIPSPKAFVSGLEPRWERAILRSLDSNPARRFATAAQFIAVLRGESTGITLALPEMNWQKWAAVSAVAVALVGGWLGWHAWAGARQRPSPEAETLYGKGVEDIGAGAYFAATKALDEAVKQAPHFTLAHARLAEAWVELAMPEKAQEQMLLARREDISRLPQRDKLQIEAIDLTITREYTAAAAKYEQMAKMGGDSASLDVDLGRTYEKAGKPEKAIEAYRRAADRAEHSAAAWLRLGVLYSRQSNALQSDQAFREAERQYQLTSNLEGLTEVAFQQGVAANRRVQYAEGAAFLHKALDTAAAGGNVQQQIRVKLQLATNAYATGDGSVAEQYAREALTLAQSNQLEIEAVIGLNALANAYFRKQDYVGAERQYEQALDLARRNGSAHYVAVISLGLAALHDQQSRPDLVSRELRDALPYFQSHGYSRETFLCLILLGRSERQQGNLQAALADSGRLLAEAEKSGNRSNLYQAYESLGLVLASLEEFPEALIHYRKSLDLSDTEEHTAYAQLHVAEALALLGNEKDARTLLDQAAVTGKKFPVILSRVAETRASLELWSGNFPRAISLLRQLSSAKQVDAAEQARLTSLLGLALLRTGATAEGAAKCEQAVQLAGSGNDQSALELRTAAIEARLAAGKLEQALRTFHEIEPQLATHPEIRWRAFALISRADPRFAPQANESLEQLRALWGVDHFQTYVTRPDIQKLSWPLLHPFHANSR